VTRSARRDRPGPEREGGRAVLFVILVLVILAGGAYVAAYLAAADKVPVGTTVSGVDVGGRSPGAAVELLQERLASRADAPFMVTVEGHTQRVPPGEVGLGVDYVASVTRAGAERSWRPSRLWSYYTSGGSLDAVKTLDQLRLDRLVKHLDGADGSSPADGAVVFHHTSFTVVPPHEGLAVDQGAAERLFWNAYLTDDPVVLLPLTSTSPSIGANQIHRFVTRFANPAVASALRLELGHTEVRLQPADYVHLLGSRTVGGRLEPTVRAKALTRLVDHRLGHAGGALAPRDATVALVKGQPQVVPSRPGIMFAPSDVGAALLRAITSPSRSARVPASVARASFTNAEARALQIHHQISTFTVPLARGGNADRLRSDAARLDGTVVHPGDGLSVRSDLGTIVSGARGDALASAVFNAAWLGGLMVGSHAGLPTYTGDYPMGRDATFRGGQDVSFTDDTRYGVLVSVVMGRPTRSHGGSLTVSLWSSPTWTVASSHGDPSNVVPAGRTVEHGHGCVAAAGHQGFDVTVTRTLSKPGSSSPDHSQSYSVHYAPMPAVVCHRGH
jgi:vancomycin resistance protein YoaR